MAFLYKVFPAVAVLEMKPKKSRTSRVSTLGYRSCSRRRPNCIMHRNISISLKLILLISCLPSHAIMRGGLHYWHGIQCLHIRPEKPNYLNLIRHGDRPANSSKEGTAPSSVPRSWPLKLGQSHRYSILLEAQTSWCFGLSLWDLGTRCAMYLARAVSSTED